MTENEIVQLIAVAAILIFCIMWIVRRIRRKGGASCACGNPARPVQNGDGCSGKMNDGCSDCPLCDSCKKK